MKEKLRELSQSQHSVQLIGGQEGVKIGNKCYLLTITEDVDSYISYEDERRVFEKSHAARKLLRNRAEKLKRAAKARQALRKKKKQVAQPPTQGQGQGGESEDTPKEALEQIMMRMALKHEHKKGIVLTGRVHPGEPQASWVLQGTIEFLLSNDEDARILRRFFVFKIVPMLNPDGVIYGNTRCSLLGVDLNRKWIIPNKYLHPTIYYAKQLVRNFTEERQVTLFCDYHGHSRKMNAFTYGCTYRNTDFDGFKQNSVLRLFPLLLSQASRSFSFKDCHFRLQKCKEATARIVVFKEFQIMNSFTLEATFYGADSHGLSCEDVIRKKSLELEKKKREREMLRKADLDSKRANSQSPKNSPRGQIKKYQSKVELEVKASIQIPIDQESESSESEEETDEPEEQSIENHMTERDYLQLGSDVCRTIIQFLPVRNYRRKLQLCLQRIAQVLHQEYINCPFVLSSSPKKRKLTEPRGSTEEEREQNKEKIELNAADLEYFSDGEDGSPGGSSLSPQKSGERKKKQRQDLMHGINELLLQRKSQAIKERERRGGVQSSDEDEMSDTTSSDSEDSVRQFICSKAKERKRSKIKELMNRKKSSYKPRKTLKEGVPPLVSAQVQKQAEPQDTKRKSFVGQTMGQKQPHAQAQQILVQSAGTSQPQKKKSSMQHKIPAPTTYYLRRQHTDFLSRLTKVAAREEHYGGAAHTEDPNSTVREVLPNLDLVPVIIDSKPIHSIYIRNRTKSQQPSSQGKQEMEKGGVEEEVTKQEKREESHEGAVHNIQSMLKISRMNIVQKHTLPSSLLPAYNSTNKSYSNHPSSKKAAKRPQIASQERKGPLMIVGSGGQATNLRAFQSKASRSKLGQHRDSAEETRVSSSNSKQRGTVQVSRTNYHIAQLKREHQKMRQEKKKGPAYGVRNELTELGLERTGLTGEQQAKYSGVREIENVEMLPPREVNRMSMPQEQLKIDARASVKPDRMEEVLNSKGNGLRNNAQKIKKRSSKKKFYMTRKQGDTSSIESEKGAERKTPTQWKLEVEIRRHEQELLQFLNFNSSFASNNRLAQISLRKDQHRLPVPPATSCSNHDHTSPQDLYAYSRSRHTNPLGNQTPNCSVGNFQNKRYSNTVIRGTQIQSSTQGADMYKPSLTPVVNKSVNITNREEPARLAYRFPSPGFVKSLRPVQKSFKHTSNMASESSSHHHSYQQTLQEMHHIAQKAQMQKFMQRGGAFQQDQTH